MKSNPNVSSSRRKSRKAHFTSDSTSRSKLMSSALSKEMKDKYKVGSMPIRKGDRVKIVRGGHKEKEGRVETVYRRRWVIHVEGVSVSKPSGDSKPIGIHPSNVVITELKMDKDRTAMIRRRPTGKDVAAAAGDDDMPELS